MVVVILVTRRFLRGLPGGCLFQRLSGDLTLRAQTRGRRGPCRLARTARPMPPARSGVPLMMLLALVDTGSAQYMPLPPGPRETLFRRLAASVTPGGSLLIVGHHPSDQQTTMPRPHMPELYFTGDEIIAYLDAGEWEVISNTAAPRLATDPDGRTVTIHDTVLRARRHK